MPPALVAGRRPGLAPPRRTPHTPAAAPPSVDASAPIVTRDDCIAYLASGCKPKEAWRIGTEHEKLGYYTAPPHARLSYDTIATLLTSLCSRFGWQPVTEGGRIIGATRTDGDGVQSVSLEPGGQLELSGAPVDTLHKTCAEANSHLYQIKACATDVGVSFLDLGFDPKWDVPDVPRMPKDRYRIMADYMPRVGTLGLDMMFRSCTIQVNLDFECEHDMVQKFQVGLALQPIATALFANSPFRDGVPSGYKSWRSHVWTDVDADRCGILPFVFEPGFGFERYTDYALDVPMYFVYGAPTKAAPSGYADATQARITFRDFLEGRNPVAGAGVRPTIKDWETHLTTIFPEVRLKRFLEMRGADGGPWKEICALPALWVGLLYDSASLAAAVDLVADWTPTEHASLRADVPVLGLDAPFRGGTVGDIAGTVVDLAEAGLSRRGRDEARFLAPLRTIADTGVTRADRLLALYDGEWTGSVDLVYSSEFTY